MKYFSIFALLLIAFVAYSSAQCCDGKPRTPSCRGRRDAGRRGRDCTRRDMWYYDRRSRECHRLHYLGCGGNDNRHCTKASCERLCRRR